ncbi:hypothetical protein ABI59_04970 [Acidobacteria bacterium Mor1]|nr:hypothetical protein ABI59_04970 [Acidobacteria bacterium Mor1]
MKRSDFDFDLPAEQIAQEPLPRRDASRLMLLDRRSGAIDHRRFEELPGLLAPGDLLVSNDTRVIPARLEGRKPSGGKVDLLLLEPIGGEADCWDARVRASHAPKPGTVIEIDDDLEIEVLGREGETFRLRLRSVSGDVAAAIERCGEMPLPPYIKRASGDHRSAADRERYQTIFSRNPGAVAAPTAGLHFSEEILAALGERGVETARLSLHVGPGTFSPMRVERIEEHRMHAERYALPEEAAEAIAACRRRGGRVIAVGTTVVRTLEHRGRDGGRVEPGEGSCDLFIYPGYEFGVIDGMITNFHLPQSTLLMLVSAFAGRERVLAAYAEAVRSGYRFFSYGDAMMVR